MPRRPAADEGIDSWSPLYRMSASAHPPSHATVEPGSGPFVTAALGLGLLARRVALGCSSGWATRCVRASPPRFDLVAPRLRCDRSRARPDRHDVGGERLRRAASSSPRSVSSPRSCFCSAAGAGAPGSWRSPSSGRVVLDNGLKRLFARVRPEPFYDYYPAPDSYQLPQRPCAVRHLFLRWHRRAGRPPSREPNRPGRLIWLGRAGPDLPDRRSPGSTWASTIRPMSSAGTPSAWSG